MTVSMRFVGFATLALACCAALVACGDEGPDQEQRAHEAERDPAQASRSPASVEVPTPVPPVATPTENNEVAAQRARNRAEALRARAQEDARAEARRARELKEARALVEKSKAFRERAKRVGGGRKLLGEVERRRVVRTDPFPQPMPTPEPMPAIEPMSTDGAPMPDAPTAVPPTNSGTPSPSPDAAPALPMPPAPDSDSTPEAQPTATSEPSAASILIDESQPFPVELFYGTNRKPMHSVMGFLKRNVLIALLLIAFAIGVAIGYRRLIGERHQKYRWVVVTAAWIVAIVWAAVATKDGIRISQTIDRLGMFYGKARNMQDGKVVTEFGKCTVTIPPGRHTGDIPVPELLKLEFQSDPDEHFHLDALQPLATQAFFADARVQLKGKNRVLVFVHGYNNDFEDAAFRTAQMVHDLKFNGIGMFFSWPSYGDEEAYPKDRIEAHASAQRLVDFLTTVRRELGTSEIHLVAHSMGSLVLTEALQKWSPDNGLKTPPFESLVMGAPDVDSQAFWQDVAPKLRPLANVRTIYVNVNDEVLGLSREFNEYTPLGATTVGGSDFDIIEVSLAAKGHSYIGDCPAVMHDLGHQVQHRESADVRCKGCGLRRKEGDTHWVLAPPQGK